MRSHLLRNFSTAALAFLILGWAFLAQAMTPEEVASTRTRAEHGDIAAQLLLGIAYLDGDGGLARDGPQAVHWLEMSGLQGNVSAALRLGDLYDEGRVIPQNLKLATDWRRRAAMRGDPIAQLQLGRMYLQGLGIAQDLGAARLWLKKAAEADNGEAAYLLSQLYRHAIGGPGDVQTADKLTAQAAYNAYGEANWHLRDIIGSFGHTSDRPLSAQALQDLANDGDIEAQLELARHYERGTGGCPRDPATAAQWYQRAATATMERAKAISQHN